MAPEPLTNEELTELTLGLNRVARNLWWTWDEGAQEVFQELSNLRIEFVNPHLQLQR